MVISKELLTQKSYSDGSHPIIIRIYNNGMVKHLYSHERCLPSHWDNVHKCVTPQDNDYRRKNESIDSLIRRISGKIQDYLDRCLTGFLDTISDISRPEAVALSSVPDVPSFFWQKGVTDAAYDFLSLIDSKIESVSSLNTRRGYFTFRRYFISRHGNGPLLAQIDQRFINAFTSQLENDYTERQTMRHLMLSHLNSVLNHAIVRRLLPDTLQVKIPKPPCITGSRNISEDTLKSIFRVFYTEIDRQDGKPAPGLMALGVFILDIAFQGLAPVDLANLKVGDLNFQTIYSSNKGNDSSNKIITVSGSVKALPSEAEGLPHKMRDSMKVVTLNTFRKKTGRKVSIVAHLDPIEKILRYLMEDKNPNDYLIPCFDINRRYSPESRQNRLANYFYKISTLLNSYISKKGEFEELSEVRVTYYFARHAYCNILDSLDVPRHIIQYLIGHQSTILEKSYLRPITAWEQAYVSRELFRLLLPK